MVPDVLNIVTTKKNVNMLTLTLSEMLFKVVLHKIDLPAMR